MFTELSTKHCANVWYCINSIELKNFIKTRDIAEPKKGLVITMYACIQSSI